MSEEIEREISELPHGRTSRSFQVLAEWLRENRRVLQEQMAGLAIRFEEVDRENKRRLDEIHVEVRRTNGRVTDLEKGRDLERALATGHTQWEQDRIEEDEKRRSRGEKRLDRLANAGYVLLGLLIGGGLGKVIGRALGLF